jgi:hypothetical protein
MADTESSVLLSVSFSQQLTIQSRSWPSASRSAKQNSSYEATESKECKHPTLGWIEKAWHNANASDVLVYTHGKGNNQTRPISTTSPSWKCSLKTGSTKNLTPSAETFQSPVPLLGLCPAFSSLFLSCPAAAACPPVHYGRIPATRCPNHRPRRRPDTAPN